MLARMRRLPARQDDTDTGRNVARPFQPQIRVTSNKEVPTKIPEEGFFTDLFGSIRALF